ncbi:MAG TPA: helicase-related protein, partial [Ignavibacteriaceae bacterium]
MENYDELANWLTTLNGKETQVIKSDYRPCELIKHYEVVPYYKDSYWQNKQALISKALDIVDQFNEFKFILFVHEKATGYKLVEILKSEGIESKFHSRDVSKTERNLIEREFEFGNLRIIVSTSVLAQGLDLPARCVAVLGTTRGQAKVSAAELNQEIGRAGRPSFDKQGDAYIIMNDNNVEKEKERINAPFFIKSTLIDRNNYNLEFHVLLAIYDDCKTEQDIRRWYDRTLANEQSLNFDNEVVNSVLQSLVKMGMIKIEDDGSVKILMLGKICCWFYAHPKDVFGWKSAFEEASKAGPSFDLAQLIYGLTGAYKYYSDISSSAQKEACEKVNFRSRLYPKLQAQLSEKYHGKV